jgi:hypothetical protein
MLEKSDAIKEKKLIEELIADDEDLRRQHENFGTRMAFLQALDLFSEDFMEDGREPDFPEYREEL